jgi:intein/homing endonuclease
MKNLTQIEINERLWEFFKTGSTLETAKKFNITSSALVKLFNRKGLSFGRVLTQAQINERIFEYYKTKSLIKTAKTFGVSAEAIYQLFTREGIFCFPMEISKRKYKFNENVFDNIDTDQKAYWLGFIAADGCVFHRNKSESPQLQIGILKSDSVHLEKFKKFMESDKPIRTYNKLSEVHFSSKNLCNSLYNYGITQRKSLTLEFPAKLDSSLYSAFIRGYTDGDGCFTYSSSSWKILGTIPFISKVQNILISELGLNKTKLYLTRNLKTVELNYSGGRQLFKIVCWLYKNATVYLDRKFEKVKNILLKTNRNCDFLGVCYDN